MSVSWYAHFIWLSKYDQKSLRALALASSGAIIEGKDAIMYIVWQNIWQNNV